MGLTPKAALSGTLLQCLAGLGLDTAASASDPTARSDSALGSILLLLKEGRSEGWDCMLHVTSICGPDVPNLTSVPI